jgi:predicted N-acetyltransferase YhbS
MADATKRVSADSAGICTRGGRKSGWAYYYQEEKVKRSFSKDPDFVEGLFDLLDMVFPGLRRAAQHARELGASWESVSTPFLHVEQGKVISHVGVIELSLVLAGQTVKVGSVHAVATHPDYRRRGYYRGLMQEVIHDCTNRYDTMILTTENPEYYEPFGFRNVREHRFKVHCDSPGGADGLRLIDTRETADIALLHRLLKTREPVSQVVGVVNELAVFCFNEGRRPLLYAEDLDTLICMELEEGTLRLFDLLGPSVPPLAALLERIPQRVNQVDVFFATDRLGVEAQATPHVMDHDGPSYLMVRGPFAAERLAFTLPRSART